MIVSRFPIVVQKFKSYTLACNSDQMTTKGVLYAKIRVHEDFHLHVFNTHMQATYFDIGEEGLQMNIQARATQHKEYA